MTSVVNAVASDTNPMGTVFGGTGVSDPTAHGIMVAEGASAMVSKTLTNGQLLVGSTGADPVEASITSSGSTLTVTPGAGTISIDVTAPLNVAHGGTGATTLTSHGILLGHGTSAVTAATALTNGQLLVGSTGNDPVPATLIQGANVTITNGAGTITIAAAGPGGIVWTDVTTDTLLVTENAYIADSASLITFTLPTVAAVGDTFIIQGKNTGGWLVAQNSGQTIYSVNAATTTGGGGSLASTNRRCAVTLVCVTANNDFTVSSVIGNLTYV